MPRFSGTPVEDDQAPAAGGSQSPKPRWKGTPVDEPAGPKMAGDVNGAGGSALLGVMDGLSFGFADEIGAGINAGVDAVLGENVTGREPKTYEEWLAKNRALQENAKENHGGAYMGGQVGGGLTGGLGLAKSGATLAGRVGTGILPRMAGYGAEGAAYGAAQGFGSGEGGAGERLSSAGTGALVGGGLGSALPAAGSAIGAAVRGGQAVVGPTIEGAGRTASAFLRGAAQADEAGLRELGKMGPDAMLVDAGPSMLGLGQGAGTGTGQGRSQLVNALRERDAATGSRLGEVLNRELGPSPVPSQVRAGLDDSAEQIGERYGLPFSEASRVDTRGLARSLDTIVTQVRGPAQDAVRRVRGYLDDTLDPEVLSRDPRVLFETRQAIDGLLTNEADPKAIRQLTIARQSVDELLQHSVPRIKEVDGQFAEVARQGEGLTRGGQVFDTGKTAVRPSELAEEIQRSALPQGEFVGPSGAPYRLRQGARAELDRLVGTGVNDLSVLERKLGTPEDWNNAKLGIVFGEEPRDALVEALANNRRMRSSYQNIVQGSQTAQRNAAQRSLDGEIDIPMDTTLAGAAAAGGRALWRALMGMSRENTKDEIGRILAKKGPEAQALVDALLERNAVITRNANAGRFLVENSGNAAVAGQIGGQRRDR